uniref:Uncharacterized protein n=1 Tax=Arundo donax TaxID=35708 RepID=A0A0A8Z9K4_ARUDO
MINCYETEGKLGLCAKSPKYLYFVLELSNFNRHVGEIYVMPVSLLCRVHGRSQWDAVPLTM